MMVVFANNLPPAVRGRMKLWFVEPRANIFVSGLGDHLSLKVAQYLQQHCPASSGLLIFRQTRTPPGFAIEGMGDPNRVIREVSGLQLVVEKLILEDE